MPVLFSYGGEFNWYTLFYKNSIILVVCQYSHKLIFETNFIFKFPLNRAITLCKSNVILQLYFGNLLKLLSANVDGT